MNSAALDRVFSALSGPARRKMLDILQERPGITIADLATSFKMTPVGVLKHVRLLERAGLITSLREGRVRRLYFNPVPIQLIYDRWTDHYSSFWTARMADIKDRLEGRGGQRSATNSTTTHQDQPTASGRGDLGSPTPSERQRRGA